MTRCPNWLAMTYIAALLPAPTGAQSTLVLFIIKTKFSIFTGVVNLRRFLVNIPAWRTSPDFSLGFTPFWQSAHKATRSCAFGEKHPVRRVGAFEGAGCRASPGRRIIPLSPIQQGGTFFLTIDLLVVGLQLSLPISLSSRTFFPVFLNHFFGKPAIGCQDSGAREDASQHGAHLHTK